MDSIVVIYMNTNTRMENSILIKHGDMFVHVDNMTIGILFVLKAETISK